jgi:hemin uptake protein HemP
MFNIWNRSKSSIRSFECLKTDPCGATETRNRVMTNITGGDMLTKTVDKPQISSLEVRNSRVIPIHMNRIDSSDLFVATREITIGHAGETYRLRLTSQNKLILTK